MSHVVLRATFVAQILLSYAWCWAGRLGPWFEREPPPLVRFPASRGARVLCRARGEPPPALSWLLADGTLLPDAPGIRQIYSNGTLEVLPSPYQPAAVTLRCRATNAHGVALSRDFTLQPVPEERWEPEVGAATAVVGGVAALTCRVPPATHADPHPAVVWYRGDTLLNLGRPMPESRLVSAGDSLLIHAVSAADAGPYACEVRSSFDDGSKRSRTALLTVTEGTTSSAPRLVSAADELAVEVGDDVCMPCVSPHHPPPHYTWYREWEGRLQAVEPSRKLWVWAGGAALCARGADASLAGAWLCKAYNVFGDATAQLKLTVRDVLTVTVEPTLVHARAGSTVRFNCSSSDARAALSWEQGGAPTAAGALLVLRDVTRAHTGVYQCFARRRHDSAQAAAELRLGESAPELVYTFIEQALRAGGGVSLRCAAAGAPPPRLRWALDGVPLDRRRAHTRYFINEETSMNGDVVSILNISSVTTEDGGRYTCYAENDFGSTSHSARLNIYGPPSIRALGPVRVVAGANATIYCPYAGYPISSVWWSRRGAALGAGGRARARGSELQLWPALPADAGHYTCAVAAPHAAPLTRDIEIQVRNPPKISPFMFSSELTEGSSVQVLCGVSSGDKPMYFSWLKDGAPLPSGLQIEEKSLNEFSLLMFSDLTARHSGEYTCRVSNHAATVNYTATLSVKVAPAWMTEPLDAAVLLGAPLLLECAAKGYPTPTVTWHKRIAAGDGSGLGPESEQWEVAGGAWGGVESAGVVVRNGSLGAAAAARAHQGQYRCTADNGVGPPLLKHVNVTVHEPAHFEGSDGNVSSVRGRSATLSCVARGDAPLTVHWTHRGVRLDLNSYKYSVSEVGAGGAGGGVRSTLTLRAAERADAGQYRCLAHNHYGRSELVIYLHVEEPPATPRGLQLGGVGSRWVRMRWRAPSPPPHAALSSLPHAASVSPPHATLYYTALCTTLHSPPAADPTHLALNLTLDPETPHGLDVDGTGMLSARLESLRPASAYSLRVAAGNHIGQSPYSEPLTFTTLEEAPEASPLNVRVRPASSRELHVSWSVPPQESWNGELFGYVVTWQEIGRAEGGEEEREEPRAGRVTVRGWNTKEARVAGLRAATRYAVAVQSYNVAGAGRASTLVYSTTSDGVPEVAPSSVTCEGMTTRSLRVRWFSPPTPHPLRGYDIQYVSLQFSLSWSNAVESETSVAGAGSEVTLQGLAAGTNYSVWVRARNDAGRGPPSPPAYCATADDVAGKVLAVRALAAAADAVRVTWLAPRGRVTHYTLHTRDLAKAGVGEWSQRVEADEEGEGGEVWREVRGLRPAVYEVWVRAATAAGPGPPSRPVTAAPAHAVSARISSIGREISVALGARLRLRCAAVGAPPIRRRWVPLPPAHTLTDTGDLIIHKVEASSGGNYTCTVRNAAGSEAAVYRVEVRLPPAAPAAPRLVRADPHSLYLAWDRPTAGHAPVLSYTVRWSRETDSGGDAAEARVPGGDAALRVRGLACGALYRVTLRAHTADADSPPSHPLLARTDGDKAVAAPGREFVWANSSALVLNLVSWQSACGAPAWRVAVRGGGGTWREVVAARGHAAARGLRPAAWHLLRVRARSPAGDTAALYRAPTRALNGERIGEAVQVPEEAAVAEEGGEAWRGGVAPAVLGGALAALLAALAGAVAARRVAGGCRRGGDARRERPRSGDAAPHPQLYSTEPTKRNGKALTPPPDGDLEISPYATFSMSERAEGGAGCALHLHTFGRADSELGAPPPRPNLLAHAAAEYGRALDSESESSGSPCAACASSRAYHLPAPPAPGAPPTDILAAVESSAEDTSYSTSAGRRGSRPPTSSRSERGERGEQGEWGERSERGEWGERGARHVARSRRRRDHNRHSSGPAVRSRAAPGSALHAAFADDSL